MRFCTLASSSSGNCTYVSGGGTEILIDAGISMRRIKKALCELGTDISAVSAVIITHEHSDHTAAIAMLTKYCRVPIYAPRGTAEEIVRSVPAAAEIMHVFTPGDTFCIGGLKISSARTMHDTPVSVGYRLSAEGKSLAFFTDLGTVTDEVLRLARGADAAVIEANHDILMLRTGTYPYHLKRRIMSDRGHLSNEACAHFAAELARSGTKKLLLAHLSRENNTPSAALGAVCDILHEAGLSAETEAAPWDYASGMYII